MGYEIMEELIKKVRKQIQDYIDNGGSIYDERRGLPYYYNLRYIQIKLQKENPNATIEDAYALCGFTMDREYHRFVKLNEELAQAADENGYVDAIKSQKNPSHTKNVLNMFAHELDCSPSDYLVLMTKYRYKNSIIQGDYISQLRDEILEIYPDGNITGIKKDHPNLYEKLRHFKRYAPEDISMNDTLAYFALKGSNFGDTTLTKEECSQIKQEFVAKYNPEDIECVKDFNFTDYQNLNKVAIKENISIYDLLTKLGYNIKTHAKVSFFSKTKVDASEREKQLLATRREVIRELLSSGVDIPQDNRELYYFNKKVTSLVMENIYNLTPVGE